MYRREDITAQVAADLIAQHGEKTAAARAIVADCQLDNGSPAALKTVIEWLKNTGVQTKRSTHPLLDSARDQAANKFLKLLDEAGVDPQAVADGQIQLDGGHFKTHGVFAKIKKPDGSEELVTKSLYSIGVKLSPSWEQGPAWPVVTQAKPVEIRYAEPKPRIDGVDTVVFVPDMHIGWLRPIGDEQTLLPIHDERAIDVALQIVADVQPHEMFNLGDAADFAEHSRFTQHPEFARTTQAGVDTAHEILARFEAAAGPRFVKRGDRQIERRRKTKLHGGNHLNRLQRLLLDNAKAAYGLRRAGEPKGWPVMSFPYLANLDALDIEYVGEKIGAEHYITDTLRVIHEPPEGKVQDPLDIVCAHDHKIWRTSRTVHTRNGPEFFSTYGMGCLCRLDRYTDESSLMPTVLPSNRQKNRGQHCIGIGYIAKDGHHHIEQVEIRNGVAVWRGKTYIGRPNEAKRRVA